MFEFTKAILIDFWATLVEMSPYLLFGFLAAGLLSVVISQAFVERHLGGRGFWSVLKATIVGVPMPLCSCGVIPVSMSLYKHGASKGATIAFLISTPQTGIDSIFVTYSLLGPVFAIFRPLAEFINGIIGGMLVEFLEPPQNFAQNSQSKCSDDCCSNSRGNKIVKALKYGFIALPKDIGRAMLLGLVIAAFISALVPDDFFSDKLGTGIVPMLVMMAVGIPMYVCASASVPIAAAMILKGLTPGAALVFLMTGPATNAATFVTIWKVLGKRTAIIYILSIAGCALIAGMALDFIGTQVPINLHSHIHKMLPELFNQACAVILLAMLIFGAASKTIKSK